MKVKPTAEMNWSKLENLRRIVVNLVRYEYIDPAKAERTFARLIKIAKNDEMTIKQLRALSASISRNSSSKRRAQQARALLIRVKSAA